MNAYILRAKPHGRNREKEFLSGRISIGWPGVGNLTGKNRNEISRRLVDKYPDITETSVSMVDLFVKVPKKSIVLTPSLSDKSLIHVLRTTSEYNYDESSDKDEVGNPHYIEAELLKTIPRNSLPASVIRSLSGARKTLSRISQHFDLLDDFIGANFEVDEEVALETTDGRQEALNVLYELLHSEDESIRLQAATAILKHQ